MVKAVGTASIHSISDRSSDSSRLVFVLCKGGNNDVISYFIKKGAKYKTTSLTLSYTDALFLVEVEDAMSHVHHRIARDESDSVLDGAGPPATAAAILS